MLLIQQTTPTCGSAMDRRNNLHVGSGRSHGATQLNLSAKQCWNYTVLGRDTAAAKIKVTDTSRQLMGFGTRVGVTVTVTHVRSFESWVSKTCQSNGLIDEGRAQGLSAVDPGSTGQDFSSFIPPPDPPMSRSDPLSVITDMSRECLIPPRAIITDDQFSHIGGDGRI